MGTFHTFTSFLILKERKLVNVWDVPISGES